MPQGTQGPVSRSIFLEILQIYVSRSAKIFDICATTSLILPYCYSIFQSPPLHSYTSNLPPHLPPLAMCFLLLHPDAESHSLCTPRPDTKLFVTETQDSQTDRVRAPLLKETENKTVSCGVYTLVILHYVGVLDLL